MVTLKKAVTLVIFALNIEVHGSLNDTGLCFLNNSLPANRTASCTHQFKNEILGSILTDFACEVHYHSISAPGCKTQELKGQDSSHLGKVSLQVLPGFLYVPVTYLVITFSKINWKNLRLRLTYAPPLRPYGFCRDFALSQAVRSDIATSTGVTLFDCTIDNKFNEAYYFEYQASGDEVSDEWRKYLFVLPSPRDIGEVTEFGATMGIQKWLLFVYIDITSENVYIVRWPKAPSQFYDKGNTSVTYNITQYKITVHGSTNKKEDYTANHIVHAGTGAEVSWDFSVPYFPSSTFYFEVELLHDACESEGCRKAISPKIVFRGFDHGPLIVGLVLCLLLLSVIFCAIHAWRKWWAKEIEKRTCPVVLLLYKPTRTPHMNAVLALTQYLNTYCHVEALVDQLWITPEQNPFDWYNNAFKRANFVMVVSSPELPDTDQGPIYKKLDVLGQQLLRETFGATPCRFLAVLLPYAGFSGLPEEAAHMRKFHLPKDMAEMLSYLHGPGPHKLLGVEVPGAKLGPAAEELLTALEHARQDTEGAQPVPVPEGGSSLNSESPWVDFSKTRVTVENSADHTASATDDVANGKELAEFASEYHSVNLRTLALSGKEQCEGEARIVRKPAVVNFHRLAL